MTTQDPARYQGLVVAEKAQRVANYQRATIHAFLELIASNGLASPDEIRPINVLRRVDDTTIRTFADVYQVLPQGCLLDNTTVPTDWQDRWDRACAEEFATAPWRTSRADGRRA